MHFLDNLRTITQKRNMETRQMTPFFFIYYFRSNGSQYYSFLNLKILRIHFHVVPTCSILVCKIPQFLTKSYQFTQLITLFQKTDTLRLLKIFIMFCPPTGAKYPFFRLQLMDHQGPDFFLFLLLLCLVCFPCFFIFILFFLFFRVFFFFAVFYHFFFSFCFFF